jgi:hypothetical protein
MVPTVGGSVLPVALRSKQGIKRTAFGVDANQAPIRMPRYSEFPITVGSLVGRIMFFRRSVHITRSAPLNWRRGLFRVWVLVSAAWIMAWAIYLILSAMAQALTKPEDFLAIPIVFFGPPIALLLCGFAAGRTLRGFRFDEKAEQSTTRPSEDKVVQLRQDDTNDYVS